MDIIIQSIQNASTGASYTFTDYVPCELQMGRYDVSASTAGRDEAGYMHKEMIGKSVKYMLKFQNIRTAVLRAICQIIEVGEYVNITMIDPIEGTAPNYLVTREYYVGDRNMKFYNATVDVWEELSFDFIERGVH